MVLDHIGVAVRSIEPAIERWQAVFGYRQLTEVVTNSRQMVNVVFLEKPGSTQIKLIEPSGTGSPLESFAQRGGGLHHLCFRCESVEAEMVRMAAAGLRIVSKPAPGEAFDNELIAFVYAGDGLNVELIDTVKRASLLEPASAPSPTPSASG